MFILPLRLKSRKNHFFYCIKSKEWSVLETLECFYHLIYMWKGNVIYSRRKWDGNKKLYIRFFDYFVKLNLSYSKLLFFLKYKKTVQNIFISNVFFRHNYLFAFKFHFYIFTNCIHKSTERLSLQIEYTVKPVLRATSEQRPPVNNDRPKSHPTITNTNFWGAPVHPLNSGHLKTTATF